VRQPGPQFVQIRELPARRVFAPGDLLFVAKGEAHRFENHTPDTAVWVIFGPGA
jgi:quercetin dioxygenase-like cupin family protein